MFDSLKHSTHQQQSDKNTFKMNLPLKTQIMQNTFNEQNAKTFYLEHTSRGVDVKIRK